MKRLLSPGNRDILAWLAGSRALVAFDFDGTLAPIVARRDDARMRPTTQCLLSKVCDSYPSAVISGRSRQDVESRLGGAPVGHIVGNHGLEPSANLAEFEQGVAPVREHLTRVLAEVPGVDVEDKRYSLALHYRKSPSQKLAQEAILGAVAALPVPMRVVLGKLVVNVIPAGAPNKGHALMELMAAEGADTALYVGDDVTDEDVFELDQPRRLLGVRVGESRSSAASYFLRDQLEMDELLAALLTLREARSNS